MTSRRPAVRNHALVYSTELGRVCPDCGQPHPRCACDEGQRLTGDGNVRVMRQTAGRGGKTVTVVTGLPVGRGELRELAGRLKQRCGTGGTVKLDHIELQGDHCDAVIARLNALGFRARRAGG